MKRLIKLNLITYLAFLLLTIAGIVYGNILLSKYSGLRVWTGFNILMMLAGIPFLFMFGKAGIPEFWQSGITNSKRIGFPFLLGLLFGLLDVIVFSIILHPEPYKELPPFTQPFPYSALLYFSGAFEIEVFYRLIPLTIICLLGKWYKNGRYFFHFFFTGAVITSLREPLEQLPVGAFWLVAYSFTSGFLMNLIQSLQFRKNGFIGSLSLRLGHYSLWHIMLGLYIQYFEL